MQQRWRAGCTGTFKLVEVYKIMEERLTSLKIPTDIRDTNERDTAAQI